MAFQLRRAKRGAIWGRVLLFGEAGRGKTYTALSAGHHLCELLGLDPQEQLAVIDTELVDSVDRSDEGQGSAEKYECRPCNCNRCHREGLTFGQFQTMKLEPHERTPDGYSRAFKVCKDAGIRVLVVDGITDCWRAVLGIANTHRDKWKAARPQHNEFVRQLLAYPGHVICTSRAKRESHHRQSETEATVIPDQDSNILYEFDIALWVDNATAQVVKTRDDRLEDWQSRHPGMDLAERVKAWCDDPRNPQGSEEVRALIDEAKALLGNLSSDDATTGAGLLGRSNTLERAKQALAWIKSKAGGEVPPEHVENSQPEAAVSAPPAGPTRGGDL